MKQVVVSAAIVSALLAWAACDDNDGGDTGGTDGSTSTGGIDGGAATGGADGGGLGDGAGGTGAGGNTATSDAGGGSSNGGAGGLGGAGGAVTAPCANAAQPCTLALDTDFAGMGSPPDDTSYFFFTAPETGKYTLTYTSATKFSDVAYDRQASGDWPLLCDTTGGVNAACCSLGASAASCTLTLQAAQQAPLAANQKLRVRVYTPNRGAFTVKVVKQ